MHQIVAMEFAERKTDDVVGDGHRHFGSNGIGDFGHGTMSVAMQPDKGGDAIKTIRPVSALIVNERFFS